jgi:hypothetical protein
MAAPTAFDIAVQNGLWVLTRDGNEVHSYGHADRAVHEAVQLARTLEETGQPARVRVTTADGKVIEIDLDPPADRPEGPPGGDRSALDPPAR